MIVRGFPVLLICIACGCSNGSDGEAISEATPQPESSVDAQLAEVQSIAQECGDATVSGDYESVLDVTLPKLIELGGGRENLLRAMRAQFSDPDAQRLVAMQVGEPLPISKFAGYWTTFVPTATTIAQGPRVLRGHTHMLAVSEDEGRIWHFLSGNKLSHERIWLFIPEFPESIAIPENPPLEVVAE